MPNIDVKIPIGKVFPCDTKQVSKHLQGLHNQSSHGSWAHEMDGSISAEAIGNIHSRLSRRLIAGAYSEGYDAAAGISPQKAKVELKQSLDKLKSMHDDYMSFDYSHPNYRETGPARRAFELMRMVGRIDGLRGTKRRYDKPRLSATKEDIPWSVSHLYGDIMTVPMGKHLAGQHDQSSHGSWADVVGTAEYSDFKNSMRDIYSITVSSDVNDPIRQFLDSDEDYAEYLRDGLQQFIDDHPELPDDVAEARWFDSMSYQLRGAAASYVIDNELYGDINDAFNGEFTGVCNDGKERTFYTEVEDVQANPMGGVTVVGSISTNDLGQVGGFERTLSWYDGDLSIKHDVLRIDDVDSLGGSGLASEFLEQSVAAYRKWGVNKIGLNTAWLGAYIWAKQGFDWDPNYSEDLDTAAARLRTMTQGIDPKGPFMPEREAALSMASRLEKASIEIDRTGTVPDDAPMPWEVAMVGFPERVHAEKNRKVKVWAGKASLIESRFHYTKRLDRKPRKDIAALEAQLWANAQLTWADQLALFDENGVEKHLAGQHDQSTHGSWADGDGTESGYKYPVSKAMDAVIAGRVGRISPLDAHFFMEKMAEREDNPDLTNLEMVGTRFYTRDNLGIPRTEMPQVPSGAKDEFLSVLDRAGIKYERVTIDPQTLHPIQSEISASKSAQIMLAEEASDKFKGGKDKARIIISRDGYVIDGHHRWAGALMLSMRDRGTTLNAIRVDMDHKNLIEYVLGWNRDVGIRPIGLGERNKNSAFNKALLAEIYAFRTTVNATKVDKHYQGRHNQKDHGNWAGVSAEVATSILHRVRENGGLSVKMLDGSEPTTGYMVAKGGTNGDIVDAEDFYDPVKGPRILSSFLKTYRKELTSGGSYLGLWHNTEDGKVYLDLSDNILDRNEAIAAGSRRNQISIWDVANFEEINTGGTGELSKRAVVGDSGSREPVRDDRRTDRPMGRDRVGQDGGQSVVIKVPLRRLGGNNG